MNALSAHPCDMADPMRDLLSAQPSERGCTIMGRRVAGGSHPSVTALRSDMSSTMNNADTMMGRCIANGSHQSRPRRLIGERTVGPAV
jgi:hypothetical protein